MHPSLPSALLLFLAQSTIVASTAAAPNNGQHNKQQRHHHQHAKRAAAAEPDPDPLLIVETVYRTEWKEEVTTVWATDDETPVTSASSTSSTLSESEIRVSPVQRHQQRPTDDPQPRPDPNRLWPAPAVRPHQTEAREPPASLLAALPSPWQDAPNAPDPEPQRPDPSQLAALPSPYEPPPDPPKPKADPPPPPPKPKSDPPPPPSKGGGGGNSDPRCAREGTLEPWQKEVLDAHNDRRLRHPVEAQCWHEGLAAAAAKAAALCNWAHSLDVGKDISGFKEGFMQNYVASSRDGEPGLQVKQQWYDGEQERYAADGNYDRDNPKPVPLGPDGQPLYETGHFSAMVWKDSTFLGCARQVCPGGITGLSGIEKYFMVCDYALPGNMGGQYRKQVLRPRVG